MEDQPGDPDGCDNGFDEMRMLSNDHRHVEVMELEPNNFEHLSKLSMSEHDVGELLNITGH